MVTAEIHRLVVGASRCGLDNPSPIPGEDNLPWRSRLYNKLIGERHSSVHVCELSPEFGLERSGRGACAREHYANRPSSLNPQGVSIVLPFKLALLKLDWRRCQRAWTRLGAPSA